MKSKFVRIAVVMCIVLGSVATGANASMPAPGTYDAQIIKSSMCDLGQGDKRACHRLKVKLATGRSIDALLWGGAVTIYDVKGRYIYRVDNDMSQGEMWERFSKGFSYLKVGTPVRIKIASCSNISCDVAAIQVK